MCFYLHNVTAGWDQEEMYPCVIQICSTFPTAFQGGLVVLEVLFSVFCGFINRSLLKKQETKPLANPGVTGAVQYGDVGAFSLQGG